MSKSVLLSVNPVVGYIDNFLDKDLFNALRRDLRSVEVKDAATLSDAKSVESSYRTARNCRIGRNRFDTLKQVTACVGELFHLDPLYCELPELIIYGEAGEYKKHFDSFPSGAAPEQMRSPDRGDQRIYTGVLYLNGAFSGGRTVFPRLDQAIDPRPGRLAFWQNTREGGVMPHPLSLHAGEPVESGEKRILSFWFRGPPGPV